MRSYEKLYPAVNFSRLCSRFSFRCKNIIGKKIFYNWARFHGTRRKVSKEAECRCTKRISSAFSWKMKVDFISGNSVWIFQSINHPPTVFLTYDKLKFNNGGNLLLSLNIFWAICRFVAFVNCRRSLHNIFCKYRTFETKWFELKMRRFIAIVICILLKQCKNLMINVFDSFGFHVSSW